MAEHKLRIKFDGDWLVPSFTILCPPDGDGCEPASCECGECSEPYCASGECWISTWDVNEFELSVTGTLEVPINVKAGPEGEPVIELRPPAVSSEEEQGDEIIDGSDDAG